MPAYARAARCPVPTSGAVVPEFGRALSLLHQHLDFDSDVEVSGIALHECYAMPRTDLVYAATSLRNQYPRTGYTLILLRAC
eukprot:2545153-Rhodomonas_salina.5